MKRIVPIQFAFWIALLFSVGQALAAGAAPRSRPRESLAVRFPEIKFENVTLREAMGFLSRGAEVNIVIDPAVYALAAPVAAPSFPGNGSPRPAPLAAAPADDEMRITLHLKNVPLGVALKYILRYKNLRYIVDDYAIVILPMGKAMPEELVTEVFRLRTGDIGSAASLLPRPVSR